MTNDNIKMNKTQINYFHERLDTLVSIKFRKLNEDLPAPAPLSIEEKLGQIRLGKAVLNEDINADSCRYDRLLDSFEFNGEGLYEAKLKAHGAKIARIKIKIKKRKQQLLDDFVLWKFKTNAEVTKALRDFENKIYK